MALFARLRLEPLRQFVPLANGAPSHDTFSRLFRALDPKAFEAAFGQAARQDAGPQRPASRPPKHPPLSQTTPSQMGNDELSGS
jgi:hypothetical protein